MKFLGTTSEDQQLAAAVEELNQIQTRGREKYEFLQKQAKDIADQLDKEKNAQFEIVRTRLMELKKLENYNKETHGLEINGEGQIFLVEIDHSHPLERLFKHLKSVEVLPPKGPG